MDSKERTDNLLHEWEAINRRIESIDARLWQGAGILLVISIGGISIIGWSPPKSLAGFISIGIIGLASLAVLSVWWYIFHRWIHLQRIYSHRAREIEASLDLWFNRYARLIEYWETPEAEILGKGDLRENDSAAYNRLEQFWEHHKKTGFVHVKILIGLRLLTIVLGITWILLIALYGIAYFIPHVLGLGSG